MEQDLMRVRSYTFKSLWILCITTHGSTCHGVGIGSEKEVIPPQKGTEAVSFSIQVISLIFLFLELLMYWQTTVVTYFCEI